MSSRIIDWVGGAIVGALIVGIANTIVGTFQQLNPLLMFLIWFAITFTVIVIINQIQERRLRKRLKIDESEWNRIREEKIKARQIYANRNELPEMLYALNQCNAEVIAKQKISNKQAIPIARAFFLRSINPRLIWAMFYFIVPFAMRKISPQYTEKATTNYAITFNSVLKDFKLGSLSVMKDPDYLTKYNRIKEYEVGLPPKLVGQIAGYIVLSNALNSLLLLREDSALWQHAKFINRVKNYLPYMSIAIDSRLSKLSGDISQSIEGFLIGE